MPLEDVNSAYDDLNRLTGITQTIGGQTYTYSYTLGPAGNRTRLVETLPGPTVTSRTVDWAYDDLYRLTKETIKEGGDTKQITEYHYDDVGNRTLKTLIVGTNRYDTTYVYDDMDRLLTESTTTTVLADAVAGPDEFWLAANPRRAGYYAFIAFCALALSAALAPLGWLGLRRRVARVRVLPAPWGKRETRRRAKNGSIALLLSTLMIVGPEQVYALGNNAAAVHAIATAAIGTVPPSSVAYTYDANGNMISKSVDGATATLYSYDAENRLVSIDPQTIAADIVTYAYDDDGIRKSKTVGDSTTHYLTDKNQSYAQVLEERNQDGDLLVRYTYGHDLIAQTRPDSGGGPSITRYYHYDGQMSTRMLSDENATPTVTDNYNYDAFGEQLNGTPGTTANNYLYTGEQFDSAADLYYLRARYYDQAAGRFLSRDTFEGSLFEPIHLHRYLYTNANPINGIDPSGLTFTIPQIAISSAIIGTLSGLITYAITGNVTTALFVAVTAAILTAITLIILSGTTAGAVIEKAFSVMRSMLSRLSAHIARGLRLVRAQFRRFLTEVRRGFVPYIQGPTSLRRSPRRFFPPVGPLSSPSAPKGTKLGLELGSGRNNRGRLLGLVLVPQQGTKLSRVFVPIIRIDWWGFHVKPVPKWQIHVHFGDQNDGQDPHFVIFPPR